MNVFHPKTIIDKPRYVPLLCPTIIDGWLSLLIQQTMNQRIMGDMVVVVGYEPPFFAPDTSIGAVLTHLCWSYPRPNLAVDIPVVAGVTPVLHILRVIIIPIFFGDVQQISW